MTATESSSVVFKATRRNRLQVFPVAARSLGLLLGLAGVVLVGLLGLRIGSIEVTTQEVWNALFHYNPQSYDETVIRSLRLPRTVIALAVGGGLAIAGAMMQAVTRNPLAGPSILGVSSGASFAIVTAIYYGGLTSTNQYVWFSFAGALGASALVFAIGSAGNGGPSPVKLALAGVVVSALLAAWTSALLLLDQETLDVVRFWLAGSVAGRDFATFWSVSPFLIGGAVACIFMGHQLNVLSMGEDTARSLGMRTGRARLICAVLVVLITGAAVAVAGPIGFVGLATPHIVRSVVGPDYRWVLPYSLVFGAILLTGADVLGRVVVRPAELQVGIITALVGAPFLVYLARHRTITN
ncbi:MAG TPA: iron ABC transporter permease [Nitrolancea sp.]|nr:iron ABC transporter permease [Nitrolancea sp.]